MAGQTSSRRQLYRNALRFLGEFGWSILAVHGANNLVGPTSLRATLWMVLPIAFAVAALLSVLTVRRQRRSGAMEQRWRHTWAADAAPDAR
jgi:hypothetical protein